MEFFEKAHMSKSNEAKSKKTTENVKKQLKQMLYGYKQSDNKLIQSSAYSKDDFDDSTSVSGFSDLNITISSHEDENISRQSVTTSEENIVNTDKSENQSPSSTISDDNHTDDFSEDSFSRKNVLNTISEDSESIHSEISEKFSKHSVHSETDKISGASESEVSSLSESCQSDISSMDSSEISLTSGILDSLPESDKSEVFDPDGGLAAKIIENLQLHDIKKCHKRKLNDEIIGISKKKGPSFKSSDRKKQSESTQVLSCDPVTTSSNGKYNENIDKNVSNIASPKCLTVNTPNVNYQTFSELMGDYKHPTVRRSYSGYQHAISTRNLGTFSEPNKVKVQTVELDANEYLLNNNEDGTNLPREDNNSVTKVVDEVCDIIIPEVNEVDPVQEISADTTTLNNSATKIETVVNVDDTDTNIIETANSKDNTLEPEVISDSELSAEEDAVNVNAGETFQLYYGHTGCIIVLKHPSELYIKGKVTARALGGTMEVYGHTLNEKPCNIYAPYCSYAQCIRTVQNTNLYYGLFGKLTSAGLTVAEAETIVVSAGDQDGVVLLEPLNDLPMEYVDKHFKHTNLFVKPQKNIDPYFIKASDMLNCSLSSKRPFKRYVTNPSWQEANVHAQKKLSLGIVCGGKGTGKSTYVRYQVNKLLPKGPVCVIDLDLGQNEFSVAGTISGTIVRTPLLGPSFTHQKNPEILLNLCINNPMDSLQRYLEAVRYLIQFCRDNAKLANHPWIINTMGMTNDLGLKILVYIIVLAHPTYLLQLESKNKKKRFDKFFRATVVKLLYLDYKNDVLMPSMPHPGTLNYAYILANELENVSKIKAILRPKDERYLNFFAYFSQLININKPSLLGITPYKVHSMHLNIFTNNLIKSPLTTKVINGKIVGLCKRNQGDNIPQGGLGLAIGMTCLGHGLVRGIDWPKQVLYVITPVPESILVGVDTVVYAEWVPELEGLESELPINTVVPFRTVAQDQHKHFMATPQRRFNPLKLLKMTRSS